MDMLQARRATIMRLCDYVACGTHLYQSWCARQIRSYRLVSSAPELHLSPLISHLSSLSSQLSALIPHLCQKPRLYKSCPYSQTGTGSLVPMSSVLRQRQRYILSSLRLAKEMVCTNQCHLSIVPRLLPQGEMHQRRIEFCFLLP